MKSLKEHKVQILAALALAFSLGMVVPNAVFAAVDDGVAAQSGDITAAEISAEDLLGVITQAITSENYNKYEALVNGYNGLTVAAPEANAVQKAVAAVKALVTDAKLTNDSTAAAVRTYIAGMDAYKTWAPVVNTINDIVAGTGVANAQAISLAGLGKYNAEQLSAYYNAINPVVNPTPATYAGNVVVLANRINTSTNANVANYRKYESVIAAALAVEAKPTDATLKVALAEKVESVLGIAGATDLNTEALMAQVKGIANYDKYVALYNSMAFIRAALPEGVTVITEDLLNAKYPTVDGKSALADYYATMAGAAKNVDASLVNNLLAFELPNTSVGKPEEKPGDDNGEDKVNTPNTGIVGLFESGALDLGTVTLIASVAVASVAGLGLIAKLYLKRKF